MLTRIRIEGFKNLDGAELYFGPFTCLAGYNASGKSNLFDALQFISDLASLNIVEAAARVRDPSGRGDVRELFTKTRAGNKARMAFDIDFIVPHSITDDFGRPAKPVATFLNYQIELVLAESTGLSSATIQLTSEQLNYIPLSKARDKIHFPYGRQFLTSVVMGPGKRTAPFISTASQRTSPRIRLHTDGGRSGKAFEVPALHSPRTILAGTNTESHPTVLAAKREMQSWRLLQLEPTALRQPDEFSADPHLDSNGAHLPATVYRLGDISATRVANRVAELVPDVKLLRATADPERRLIVLNAEALDGIVHTARALSDGTLRFIALAVLAEDVEAGGLFCLEEPENGIHPLRVRRMLALLQSIAVDARERVGKDNPLRQVIVNTHSQLVVSALPADSLIVARRYSGPGGHLVGFEALPGTWRTRGDRPLMHPFALGDLRAYLMTPEDNDLRSQDSDSIRRAFEQLVLFNSSTEAK